MQKPGSQYAFDARRSMQGEMLRSRDSSIVAAQQSNSVTMPALAAQRIWKCAPADGTNAALKMMRVRHVLWQFE
jgi:hypothetical protein